VRAIIVAMLRLEYINKRRLGQPAHRTDSVARVGSLVTLVSTRNALERRAIANLFGVLPKRKVVVHMLPQWLEWLLALIVGFLVMESARYWLHHREYAALLSTSRPRRVTEWDGKASDQSSVAVRG